MPNFYRQIFPQIDDLIRKIFDEIVSSRTLVFTENFLKNALHSRRGFCVCSVQNEPNGERFTVEQSRTPPSRNNNRRLGAGAKKIDLAVWIATPRLPLESVFRFNSIQKLLTLLAVIPIPIHCWNIAKRRIFECVSKEKCKKWR